MLKVKPLLFISLLPLCPLTGAARELYCDPAVEMVAGSSYTDSLPDGFISCDYHFRVELPMKAEAPEWGVRLGYGGGLQYEIVLIRDGGSAHDIDFAAPVIVKAGFIGAGEAVKTYRIADKIDQTMDGWSVRLVKRVEDDSVRCVIGQREALFEFNVASERLTEFEAFATTSVRLSRLSLYAEEGGHAGRMGRFADVGQLSEYLATSADRSECMWRYLDRNADQRRLNTGGDYSLATVRCSDGSYDLIYLGGARVNSGRWHPMMVKGRLMPTAFADHYDLIWYDAFGRAIDAEASADIIDGAILRINLPLHGGTIRYQRDVRATGGHRDR